MKYIGFAFALLFFTLTPSLHANHTSPGTVYVDDNCANTVTPTSTPTIDPTLTLTPTTTTTPTGTPNGTQTNPFCTIQDAVNHANNTDTIRVAPGTYPESVNVTKSVKLLGPQADKDARTRVDSAVVEPEAVVGIATGAFQINADNVMINGFTIQGVTSGLSAGVHTTSSNSGHLIYNNIIQDNSMGVYLNSNGEDTSRVRRNAFLNNDQPGAAGGTGIYSDQGLRDAEIARNRFVNNPNVSVLIGATQSLITPTTTPTSNWMTLNRDIDIERNQSNNTGAFAYLLSTSDSEISRNTIDDVNEASVIFLGGGNRNIEVSRNEMNAGTGSFSGIRVRGDQGFGPNQGLEMSRNVIQNVGDYGIGFAPNAIVGNNTIVERNEIARAGLGGPDAGDGINIDVGNNNLRVERNVANFNGRDGIRVGSTNLRIERNSMQANTEHDAHDLTTGSRTAGTANAWSRNECITDQPDGLCSSRPRLITPTVTPTVTPTLTPTVLPSATPTAAPTVTPTSVPPTPTDSPPTAV